MKPNFFIRYRKVSRLILSILAARTWLPPAAESASSSVATPPSEPGTTGIPASFTACLAAPRLGVFVTVGSVVFVIVTLGGTVRWDIAKRTYWYTEPTGTGGNTTFADISGATSASYTTPAGTVSGGTANISASKAASTGNAVRRSMFSRIRN